MKKRTLRMEQALKIIQIWTRCDAMDTRHTRAESMRHIENLATKALRKKAKPE